MTRTEQEKVSLGLIKLIEKARVATYESGALDDKVKYARLRTELQAIKLSFTKLYFDIEDLEGGE